jgi:hypothetical protein
MREKICPQCRGPLVEVRQSSDSPLNSYQWRSQIAGEWYCTKCPSNDRGNQPLCYWWTHELPWPHDFQI